MHKENIGTDSYEGYVHNRFTSIWISRTSYALNQSRTLGKGPRENDVLVNVGARSGHKCSWWEHISKTNGITKYIMQI